MPLSKMRTCWNRLQRILEAGAIALLLTYVSSAQHAAKPTLSAANQEGPCDKAMSQMEMNTCSGEQYHKADARLNAVYAKALSLFESDLGDAKGRNDKPQESYERTALDKLKAAERAWLQYRDLHCDAAGQQY